MLFMNLVEAHRVGDEFNQTTVRARRQNLIGLHPQIDFLELEDLVNLADQLHRELLLPHVVIRLHNDA